MDIRDMRKKTRVYETVSLTTDYLAWSNAKVVNAYRDEGGRWSLEDLSGYMLVGYIHPVSEWSEMSFVDLPVEFFNHQLREYDPHNESSVRLFVEKWGFPFIPLRNMAGDVGAWRFQDRERIDSAFCQTAAIRDLALVLGNKFLDDEYWHDNADASEEELEEYGEDYLLYRSVPEYGDYIPVGKEAEYYKNLYESGSLGNCDAISLEEASLALEMLQDAVDVIMEHVKNGTMVHTRYTDALNMGASYPRQLHWEGMCSGAESKQQHYSMLTSAICNQIIDSFADTAPWRECACEGCGISFKRKQSKASSPASDSIYCCTACEERQKKRNQRAAAKNRIRH